MISRAEARRIVARLSQMRGYPRADEQRPALDALIDALCTADDETAARIAVDRILESAAADTYCPLPAEIRKALYDAKERSTVRCASCGGTGARIEHVIVTRTSDGLRYRPLGRYIEDPDELARLAASLGPGQTIHSAARGCTCLDAGPQRPPTRPC